MPLPPPPRAKTKTAMPKAVLDAIDRQILEHLIKNARMPFLEIARKCGISGAAIHQRVRKLDEMGIILGARLEVDPKKLGFDVCALIGLRVSDPSKYGLIVERLKNIPEIVECHFITGEYNMMLKVYCVDNEHLMRLLFDKILDIEGIMKTETFLSLLQSFSRQLDLKYLEEEAEK